MFKTATALTNFMRGVQGHYSLFGAQGVYLVAKAKLLRRSSEVKIAVDGVSHPIHLRLRTTDVSTFIEIIVHREYDWDLLNAPRIIVDAGANIGLSSIFYANKHPEARIIAIEPETSNFEMLAKNTRPYPNISAVHGALWKENKTLNISDPGQGQWGFQTKEAPESCTSEMGIRVRGMTLDKLMDECGIDYIDVLKIDIEGSEKEVFENSAHWIDRVGMIAVELHDRFKNGCSSSVYSATKDFEVSMPKGETIFFARNVPGRSANTLSAPNKPSWRCKILSAE
jgi:FkbM family methyltransferase